MENTKQNNKLVQVTSTTIQTNQDIQRTIQWGRKKKLVKRMWQPKENLVMVIA
jgi:hypothetical protein